MKEIQPLSRLRTDKPDAGVCRKAMADLMAAFDAMKVKA